VRPIVAWHDEAWLFVINPILDQPFAGPVAAKGPSIEPALKVARSLGPVAASLEYYASFGALGALLPVRQQDHFLFEVVDLLSVPRFELSAGVGEGLTPASAGLVFKLIAGYEFDVLKHAPQPVALAHSHGRLVW
jgi:hypothetical protein